MVSAITYEITADFDRTGTYEFDLRDYIDEDSTLTIERQLGRNGEIFISEISLSLNNETGIFTNLYSGNVKHAGSTVANPLYQRLEPYVPIRFIATVGITPYPLWLGYIMRYENDYPGGDASQLRCTITCRSRYMLLKESIPEVAYSDTRDTDGALEAIRDAVGMDGSQVSLADGVQDLSQHFCEVKREAGKPPQGNDALTEWAKVVVCELGGFSYERSDGVLRFEPRTYRLGGYSSPNQTWGDGTNIGPAVVAPDTRWDDVYAAVVGTLTVRQADSTVTEIYLDPHGAATGDSIEVPANTTLTMQLTFSQPVISVTTPTLGPGNEIEVESLADGTGVDRSAFAVLTFSSDPNKAVITIRNTSALSFFLTRLSVEATSVVTVDKHTAQYRAELAIPNVTHIPEISIDLPFLDPSPVVHDYIYGVMVTHRYPITWLTVVQPWDHDDAMIAMLGLELGMLIRFKDQAPSANKAYVSNIDEWYRVEAIRHVIRPGSISVSQVLMIPADTYFNPEKVVRDNFDRPNATGDLGTTETGDTWLNDSTWDIVSGKAKKTGGAVGGANFDLGTADMKLQVSIAGIAAASRPGLLYRYVDTNNWWRVGLSGDTSTVILEKNVAGGKTQYTATWALESVVEMRILAQNTRHRVWLNRRLVLDVTDSAHSTATQIGLYSTADANVTFDNFVALGLGT